MTEKSPTILIVEDDLDVADMLNAYFNVQGYSVQTANWGEDAVRVCQSQPPQLVILDIRLPDIDGFEVARRLRHNRRTANIPIIFLTEKRARNDRLQGLELGADDYITKPFDVQELRLRVRNALSRSTQGAVNNPVTNLPEGQAVHDHLKEMLKQPTWSVLKLTVERLDGFREMYGFVASDDVLRAISLMVNNTVRDTGGPDDFVGQSGPTEFLVITQPANISTLAERLRTRIDQSLEYFYPLKDRGRKEIQKNHLLVTVKVFDNEQTPAKDLAELKQRLA